MALSPVDTVADPHARHTRALRPVLSAERFGWSKGPVSPPPPSPSSWAERDDDSKGGDGNTGSSRSATAGSYARDVELMGATIELTCGDAAALDRSWRRTMEVCQRVMKVVTVEDRPIASCIDTRIFRIVPDCLGRTCIPFESERLHRRIMAPICTSSVVVPSWRSTLGKI